MHIAVGAERMHDNNAGESTGLVLEEPRNVVDDSGDDDDDDVEACPATRDGRAAIVLVTRRDATRRDVTWRDVT